MAKFKGKNSIRKVATLAKERAKYNLLAFPENDGMGPKQVVDFNFAEKGLYGRVDRQHNPVIAKSEFIIPLSRSNNRVDTVRLMNFVTDQFIDFESHFVRACRLGLIPVDDPVLSSLQVKRGYEDPLDLYRVYVAGIMETYITNFLGPRKNQVTNFQQFLNHFPEFMRRMRDIFPVTFSGFQRSSQSSIFTSGLTIDIGGVPFDNDQSKEDLLFNSPAFQFYINLAKQYGFSVNKRNPGVIISDLASPVTATYRNNYNLKTVNSVFYLQYSKTLYQDLDELTKVLVDYYNFFVHMNPNQRTFKICNDKTLSELYRKQSIDRNNININSIIYLYIIIRNIEERNPYEDSKIQGIYENAIRISKHSQDKMIEFIDDQFKSKYNLKDGSLTYYSKRFQKKLDK